MSNNPLIDRQISPKVKPEDKNLDGLIRPQQLKDFIGQEKLKTNLSILIEAAKGRKEPLDHLLFHGPPGLGKCITSDSLILTDKGLIEFSKLIPPEILSGQFIPHQIKIYGLNGLEDTSHIYSNGVTPTIRLRTRSGFELEGTPNHPVLVATPDGPRWKPLGELGENEFVAIARGTDIWGEPYPINYRPAYFDIARRKLNTEKKITVLHEQLTSLLERPPTTTELTNAYTGSNRQTPTPSLTAKRLNLPLSNGKKFAGHRVENLPDLPVPSETWHVPAQLDGDLAYLMGLLVGDGNFERKQNAPAFVITVSETEIQQEIIRICREKFRWEPKVKQYGQKAPKLRFSQNYGHLMLLLGVKPVLAGEKVIPCSILNSSRDAARGFLQGLFDADGHAWPEGYIDWVSKSELLAKQVQILLANFGVIAHRTKKVVNEQTYWQLFIGGRDAAHFYKQVGFRLSRKQNRQDALNEMGRGASRSDLVPFAHLHLKQLLDASRPHSRKTHKLFDHVKRGDRMFSRSQIEKYLNLLPAFVRDLPAAKTLQHLGDSHFYWDSVASLQPGVAEVFDFCVPGSHSFVANGFFNHNTTLAHVVTNEMNVNIRITAGPAIERAGDLAAILTNLRAGDVLFIDEVHRLGRAVEEILYPAMEDFVLDLVVGKGPGAKNVRLKLPKFTVIGATTRLALITAPLRARFGALYRMDFYELEAIQTIVERGARILNVPIEAEGAAEIARRARGTPRVALRLLRRVRDFAQVRAEGRITVETAGEALRLLEIDELGLDDLDRRVLRAIIEKFGGGPVGLETIGASISEEPDTIMDVVEPYLLQLGFLERTARGRIATPHAYKHLGLAAVRLDKKEEPQPRLL